MDVRGVAVNSSQVLHGQGPSKTGTEPVPFAKLFQEAVAAANDAQARADEATRALALGLTDNLHQVVLAVTQAELTFRLLIEVRNKLIDAYHEIMRMQV